MTKRTIVLSATPSQWPSLSDLVSIIVSAAAFVISVVSLWKSYLSPFKVEITHSSPTFCLYKVTYPKSKTRKGTTWWIPSFDVSLSFFNQGQKTGKIIDVRIVADLTLGGVSETVMFSPRWIVRNDSFIRSRYDRKKWLSTSIETDWYPQILPSGETRHIHLILETKRWDLKETGVMKCRLEVFSSESKEWKVCAIYHELPIDDYSFESGDSWVLSPA